MGMLMQGLLDEGMQQGLRKGKAEWLLATLQRQALGPIPRAVRQRIARASLDELEAWFQQAHTAPSLEAIFRQAGLVRPWAVRHLPWVVPAATPKPRTPQKISAEKS